MGGGRRGERLGLGSIDGGAEDAGAAEEGCGIGGLAETNLLCSAPTDHAGGTFSCDAALFLGVPASAGAGTYTGGLVLTLV